MIGIILNFKNKKLTFANHAKNCISVCKFAENIRNALGKALKRSFQLDYANYRLQSPLVAETVIDH